MTIKKGAIYTFKVVEKFQEKKAVLLEDEFGQQHYFPRLLSLDESVRLKVIDIDISGKYLFKELQDYSRYKEQEVYEFDVICLLKNKTDVTYFSLHDRVNNVYTKVRAFMSQLPPNEVPKTLRCKVISVDQATNVLKLHQFFEDDYDSVYQDGEFYEFTYVESRF